MSSLRIIFMGTPGFAVPSLDILVKNGYNIVGVITAPDKPAGRGNKIRQSAIKEYAVTNGLQVLQPTNLKSPDFARELQTLNADLQVVVAFRMLPEVVWNMPPKGTFNLHASLLPAYRGAAPINWAIINGEVESGATTFMLRHEIDTGSLLFQDKVSIGETETAGDLHDKLMITGAELVLKTVKAIDSGDFELQEQDLSGAYPKAPKIFRETCEINWNKPVDEIYNLIRGLSPYPAAFTQLNEKTFKIYKAKKLHKAHSVLPGTYHKLDGQLAFAATDGFIIPEEVQIEGKRRMTITEFLNGFQW